MNTAFKAGIVLLGRVFNMDRVFKLPRYSKEFEDEDQTK